MYKKTVEYVDFSGNERRKTLYFVITESNQIRMMMNEMEMEVEDGNIDPDKVRSGLQARINGVMDRGKGSEMLELFDWLMSYAYGEIEDDGEAFVQSLEIYEKWKNTASHNKFFTELMNDTQMMIDFTNGILPKVVWDDEEFDKIKEDPEFKRHREKLKVLKGERSSKDE